MKITFQPVSVAFDEDQQGLLVFADGALAALLVRLSDSHGALAGGWFLEVGLGRLESWEKPVFNDLEVAQDWLAAHLADNPLDRRS